MFTSMCLFFLSIPFQACDFVKITKPFIMLQGFSRTGLMACCNNEVEIPSCARTLWTKYLLSIFIFQLSSLKSIQNHLKLETGESFVRWLKSSRVFSRIKNISKIRSLKSTVMVSRLNLRVFRKRESIFSVMKIKMRMYVPRVRGAPVFPPRRMAPYYAAGDLKQEQIYW